MGDQVFHSLAFISHDASLSREMNAREWSGRARSSGIEPGPQSRGRPRTVGSSQGRVRVVCDNDVKGNWLFFRGTGYCPDPSDPSANHRQHQGPLEHGPLCAAGCRVIPGEWFWERGRAEPTQPIHSAVAGIWPRSRTSSVTPDKVSWSALRRRRNVVVLDDHPWSSVFASFPKSDQRPRLSVLHPSS